MSSIRTGPPSHSLARAAHFPSPPRPMPSLHCFWYGEPGASAAPSGPASYYAWEPPMCGPLALSSEPFSHFDWVVGHCRQCVLLNGAPPTSRQPPYRVRRRRARSSRGRCGQPAVVLTSQLYKAHAHAMFLCLAHLVSPSLRPENTAERRRRWYTPARPSSRSVLSRGHLGVPPWGLGQPSC
jgi:hypothetical protein